MFYDNLKAICDKKGVKITPLVLNCGGTKGMLSGWKKGASPSIEIISILAMHLNVTTDSLIFGVEQAQKGVDGLTMIQRIHFVMNIKELDKSDFCKFLGVSQETYDYWILTGNNPSNEYYSKICEYLKISFAYLSMGEGKITDVLGLKRKQIAMTTNEDEMLIIFRMLNEKQQLRLIGRAEEMADQNRREENVG